MALTSEGNYRRNYPRRSFKRTVGILFKGQYFLAQAGEIGEGGISVQTDLVLTEEEPLLISFQIPNGDFVFLRAIIRSMQKINKPMEGPSIIHGLSFENIQFTIKRQIRSYVSSRGL